MSDTVAAIQKLLLLVLLGASLAGCASTRAQVVEDQPALVVPPVPPRSIEPPRVVEPPPAEPAVEPPPTPTTTFKPANRSPRQNAEKQESKPPDVPPDTTVPANPSPVPPLRTATTPSGPEAARQIRDILERATNVLAKVDYQKLSDDRKANYNSAKNYMQQADEALKKDDLTLARSFADRAENIAKVLESGR